MADDSERLPDLDPELRALVSAYETSTARDVAQVDAALARVTAKAGTAGSGGAASSTTTTKIGIVGGLAGVVTIVGLVALGPASEPASPRPVVTPSTSTAPEPAVVETPAEVPVVAPPSATLADPVVVERPDPRDDRRAKSERSPRASKPPATESSLKAELELLRQARSALREGRADDALTIVRRHRREYPASAIAEERDATEVSALCALGRLDEEACR